MSRRHTLFRAFTSVTPLLRSDAALQPLKGAILTVPHERRTEGLELRSPGKGISSSAIIFRFLHKWEDVEGTIERLERRRLLTSRHLVAAFKILQTLPNEPSTEFLTRLASQIRTRAAAFGPSDIAALFKAFALLQFDDYDTLKALAGRLLKGQLLTGMTRSELVQYTRSVRWVQETGNTFALFPQLKDALVEEVLRPSRLKKFADGQLLVLLTAMSGFQPVPFEALESVVLETSTATRHLSIEDHLKLLRLPALHAQESAVVDGYVKSLLQPARLQRCLNWELKELFEGVRAHRPGDTASLKALAEETSRPQRLMDLSLTQKRLIAQDLLRAGYAEALSCEDEYTKSATETHT